jgi:hypothetical protein
MLDKGDSGRFLRIRPQLLIEPGEGETTHNRAARIVEIASDILRQDKEAKIVICGDFNK